MAKQKSTLSDGDAIAYAITNNEDSTVWTLEVFTESKVPITEEDFMMCLESYINDWFKDRAGSAFDRMDQSIQ